MPTRSGTSYAVSGDPEVVELPAVSADDASVSLASLEGGSEMEYEPTTDENEDDEFLEALEVDGEGEEDESEDEDMEFQQGDEDRSPTTVSGMCESDSKMSKGKRIADSAKVTREQLLRLLNRDPNARLLLRSLRRQNFADDDDDDEDEDEGEDDENNSIFFPFGRRARRSGKAPKTPLEKRYPPIPNPDGVELMSSATFGANDPRKGYGIQRAKAVAARVLNRELGLDQWSKSLHDSTPISQGMIPSTKADMIVHYDSRCYSGQFSDDGNFFFACSQDFVVRMYDTSNPYDWKHYKSVLYPYGRWTITDATLSPDNRRLAYTSITPIICLAPTDPDDSSEPINLDISGGSGSIGAFHGYSRFGIWSVRFSGDGRELVAGTSDNSVYVYDLEASKTILEIPGHTNDVNAVCFGDKSSPHILYSGSDDATLKVWDRRSLADRREAGVFVGHTEGLTYIDSKGDGRYVLSNSKDQTMKLWDLRKMVPSERFKSLPEKYRRGIPGFDYRGDSYDEDEYVPDPNDCSVVTFRGHSVLKTLIRCHFSPQGSTNSRYVYTGSRDGIVYVYNLDGTIAGQINVNETTMNTRPQEYNQQMNFGFDGEDANDWVTCVRDVSWHPNAPLIAATSWNGYGMGKGTCTVHSWTDGAEDDEGMPKMGARVNESLKHEDAFYAQPQRRRASQRSMPRRWIA